MRTCGILAERPWWFAALASWGIGALRVPPASAGEPHRLQRAVAHAAQNPAGGDHARGLHPVLAALYAAAGEARFPLVGAVHAGRALLHVPRLRRIIGSYLASPGGRMDVQKLLRNPRFRLLRGP